MQMGQKHNAYKKIKVGSLTMLNSNNDFFSKMVALFGSLVMRKSNQADNTNPINPSGALTNAELIYRYNAINDFCEFYKTFNDYCLFEKDFTELLDSFKAEMKSRGI